MAVKKVERVEKNSAMPLQFSNKIFADDPGLIRVFDTPDFHGLRIEESPLKSED